MCSASCRSQRGGEPRIKDFKFVPLMFVTLGVGYQIPLFRTIFHGSLNPKRYSMV